MPKSDKLREQLKSNPADMSYSDLRKLLTALGWGDSRKWSACHRYKSTRGKRHVGSNAKQG